MNHPDPISFIPVAVDTTGRMCDEFILLLFVYDHREVSSLDNELPEESDFSAFRTTSVFHSFRRSTPILAPSLVLFPPSSV